MIVLFTMGCVLILIIFVIIVANSKQQDTQQGTQNVIEVDKYSQALLIYSQLGGDGNSEITQKLVEYMSFQYCSYYPSHPSEIENNPTLYGPIRLGLLDKAVVEAYCPEKEYLYLSVEGS